MGQHDWLVIMKGKESKEWIEEAIQGCIDTIVAQMEARRGHPIDPDKIKAVVEDHGDRLIVRVD